VRRSLGLLALVLGMLFLPVAADAKSLHFGIHTPNDPFGGNTDKVEALQRDTGRQIEIVSWFQSWGGDPWLSAVHRHVFKAVTDRGRTPFIAWEPWEPNAGPEQPRYALSRIADGQFDAFIARFARGLRDLHDTIYMRPMHEMNGNWYPWSGTVNGNSAELYKQAWIRMHDIFRAEGATNVRWVFAPINEDWPITDANRLERYYPGRSYVDVLAVDGYNWGATKPNFGGWRSFKTTFSSVYRRLKRLGPQPIWIAEVGSAIEGGNKAAWIKDMFSRGGDMRRLNAIVWMDTIDADEGDWRVRSSPDVTAAFRPAASALAAVRLRVAQPVKVGRRASVRWSSMGAEDDVERWRVYLNGKRVRTLSAARSRVLRKTMRRPGRYRWTVRGVDADGSTIVSASRRFRVVRRR